MAVAFLTGTNSQIGEGGTAISLNNSASMTATAGANNLLLVWLSFPVDPGTITSVTWNGTQTMTQFGTNVGSVTTGFAALFYLLNPASGANNVAANWTNLAAWSIFASEYSGVSTVTPLANFNSATGTASSPAAVTITTVAGDAACGFSVNSFGGLAADTQTTIFAFNGNANAYMNSYGLASGSSVAFSWSIFAAPNWVAAGVDIQAPTVAGINIWPYKV